MSDKALFDAIRVIKGSALTQADVDSVNRALGKDMASAMGTGLRASAAGVGLIHSFENLSLSTYKDPGSKNGLPISGGWGSTRDHEGKPFVLNFNAPKQYWDKLFARDLGATEVGVNMLLDGAPTTQAQFDALVSFAYNVCLDMNKNGIAEGLGDSTLLKKHKAGDFAGARAQFALWNKNDGKVLNGLTRRRAAEAAMYGG